MFIAKCTSDGSDISVDDVFSKFLKENTGLSAKQREPFFVVFETYGPLMDVYLASTDAYVKDIILP